MKPILFIDSLGLEISVKYLGGLQLELMECITGRRSIRSFTEEPVKDEDILLALEAATYAPSPFNSQPWNFIIIKNVGIKVFICNRSSILNRSTYIPHQG